MTKEELKKEAEEYAIHNDWFEFSASVDKIGNAIRTKMERAYIASAEPREKRIAELEAQIEKMKCCQNCDNWNWKHSKCEKKLKGDCFKHSKWVMRNF